MSADDQTDLPFDPIRVRLKIHALRKQVDGLTALMESYGQSVDPPRNEQRGLLNAVGSATIATHQPSPTTTRKVRAAKRGAGPKIADLSVEAMTRLGGGRVHGSVIREELKRLGHFQHSKSPDSNISTALSRDPRVRRVPNLRNTWELV